MEVTGRHPQSGTGLIYTYSATYSVRQDRVEWDAVLRMGKVVEAAFDQYDLSKLPAGTDVRALVVAGVHRAIDEMEPSMLTISRSNWAVR